MATLQYYPKANQFESLKMLINTIALKPIIHIIERQNIPRIAKGERQCKRAQKQHRTTQRKKHQKTNAGISGKKKKKLTPMKSKKKHIYTDNWTRMMIWVFVYSCKSWIKPGSGRWEESQRWHGEPPKVAGKIEACGWRWGMKILKSMPQFHLELPLATQLCFPFLSLSLSL